jgi:hypothetical protein
LFVFTHQRWHLPSKMMNGSVFIEQGSTIKRSKWSCLIIVV